MNPRLTSLVASVLCTALASPLVSAETVTFRTEVFPIATLDISSQQVLQGARDGAAAQVAGELRLPVTTAQKVPAVVFLHGDAGQIYNQESWAETFNAVGVAVFMVDSYSGRGMVSDNVRIGDVNGSDRLDGYARIVDAYRALALLARHPRIDPARIAVMGVSTGGRMSLIAAMPRFSRPFAAPDTRFSAYIALYPDCNVTLREETVVDAVPIRIYIGAADNVTAAEPCRRYVERLRAAGADIAMTEYPGAYHGFDNPAGKIFSDDAAYSAARCNFAEHADGTFVNAETGARVRRGDACVTRGFTAGRDAAGAAAVHADVTRFLEGVWRADR